MNRHRLRAASGASLVVAAVAALAGAPQAPQAGTPGAGQQAPSPTAPSDTQPSFKAGVDIVSLNVTVTDGPRYVTDLQPEDFQVFEDGVKQDLVVFNRANLPIALALLMDTSASMELRLPTAQEAAVGFSKRLRPQDIAEIVDFDSRVVILQGFTNDSRALEQAIRKTSAGGSTSMYNAIYIALKELKKIIAESVDQIRRQAIVVLSDGEDTSSLLPFEEVLDLAKRSETAIYAIGLRSTEAGSARGFKEAEFVLRQLAQETGGRAFFPTEVSELPGIYTQISDELSSQFSIGYTSKNIKRDGAWRNIVVRIGKPNLSARTKRGYFGPTGRGS